jgi:molecular chaperone DnaJ
MAAVAEKTYYERLGVSRDASPEEMRKAYLKLAHRYHPDKTGGDPAAEAKLKEINAAYDTLKNVDKRREYDQTLDAQAAFGGGGAGFGGFDFTGGGGGFQQSRAGQPFEDIFGSFFGGVGGRARPQAQPGNDLEVRVDVMLREVAEGVRRTLQLNMRDLCADCRGSGAAPGTQPQVCPDCGGGGYVQQARGPFSMTQPCRRCRGTGTIVPSPCPKCGGTGRMKAIRSINVTIPAGVSHGTRLRLAGEGEPGPANGPRGDLFVVIHVAPDERFEREGKNLLVEVPVRFDEAVLGAEITVPTLTGKAKLKVPPGSETGNQLRMKGLGLPGMKGGAKGDQIVRLVVETPQKLTHEQRELLERFAKIASPSDYPKKQAFLRKLQ